MQENLKDKYCTCSNRQTAKFCCCRCKCCKPLADWMDDTYTKLCLGLDLLSKSVSWLRTLEAAFKPAIMLPNNNV